jgi:hypothetical protein
MRRAAVALAVVLVAFAGIGLAGRAIWKKATTVATGSTCTFGDYQVDTGQAAVASTMVGVVLIRGLPSRAAVLVIAAALQESKLRNIPAGQGDLDSVGVLQQRPSQGWGSAAQLADVAFATGAFLNALVKVANWQNDTLAQVIQAVQISADGSAYAKHENRATAVANALTGATAAGVSCTFDAPTQVASPQVVAAQVASQLPVNAPTTSGHEVVVAGAGWATAAWFVANADRLGIDTVAYASRTWTLDKGWKASSAAAASVRATLHS